MFRFTLNLESIFGSRSKARSFNSLGLWIFTKLMDAIASHLRQRSIPIFPYLDDWLIRDLIRNRLISHTKYSLQTVQSLGFIPNLKKSELIRICPEIHFSRDGISYTTEYSQGTTRPSRFSNSDISNCFFLRRKFRHELSFLFWAKSVQQQTLFS